MGRVAVWKGGGGGYGRGDSCETRVGGGGNHVHRVSISRNTANLS